MGLDGDALEPVETCRCHVTVPDIELHIAEAVEVKNLTFDPSLFDGWVRDLKFDERIGVDCLTQLVERQSESRGVLRPERARRGHETMPTPGSTRCSRT
jgi:hypothetical protein